MIGTVCAALTLLLGCSNPAPEPAPSFETFWMEFRTAALARDAARIVPLTRFPFETKGVLDDAAKQNDETAFRALFPRLLEQDVGLSAEPESMLNYMQRNAKVTAGEDRVRVGQFVFEKVQNRWMFVSAYLEE
jgi:hypothetical protein